MNRYDIGARVRVIEPHHSAFGGYGTVLSGPEAGYDRSTSLYEVLVDGDDIPWWLWNDTLTSLTAIEQLGDVFSRNQR